MGPSLILFLALGVPPSVEEHPQDSLPGVTVKLVISTDAYDPSKPSEASDVEEAVIGHGKVEGPFAEIDGLEIERDDRYPIRVTVQFYKATSNGVVSGQDMADIAEQINKVYRQADYVGSLVVQGPTGRPTEYEGAHVEPPQWWDVFWQRHFQNTGQTREQAIEMLRTLLGERWQESTLEQAEQAVSQADTDAN